MLLTLKLRQNVFYDITNVEQHELFGFDVGHLLSEVIPKRMNSLAVVEDVLSSFCEATATAGTIGHVCQAHLVIQVEKEQRVPCKNSELFKKSKTGAKFLCKHTSSID